MESYETNLNRIKEDIKAGKMIGNTVTENQEIQALHNELEDIKAQNRLLEKNGIKSSFMPYETLKKIDTLANKLNNAFANSLAFQEIKTALDFYDKVEALPAMEKALFYKIEKEFGDAAVVTMKKNNMNVFLTDANLNGFDDILEYAAHKNKQSNEIERVGLSEEQTKNLELKDVFKAAIIEAMKELKANQ
jgi:hypothetical protein